MNSLSAKIYYPFICICTFAFISCNDDEIVYPEGGYSYLKNIAASDSNFYFLPIRQLIPRRDSLQAVDIKYLYMGFNEPNLSLNPPSEDIFRFVFECGFCGKEAIITLTKNEIVIKKNIKGLPGISIEPDLLSSIEKEHYTLIDRYYPFDDPKYSIKYKHYFDSLINLYPELLDHKYFEKLKTKATIIHNIPLKFTTKKILITPNKFKYFVELINKSEFWQRVYYKSLSKSCKR